MGFDQFILATHQITDEALWSSAMAAISKEFAREPYFIDHFKDPASAQEISNALHNRDLLLSWSATESINFAEHGFDLSKSWRWHSFHNPSYLHSKGVVLVGERLAQGVPVLDALRGVLADLEARKTLPRDLHEHQVAQEAISEYRQMVSVYESLSSEQREALEKTEILGGLPSPPTRFEFAIGEHPKLPVFGRFFRRCSSKISGQTTQYAQPVLDRIANVLQRFFPDSVCNVDEDDAFTSPEPRFFRMDKSPDATEKKTRFYESLPLVCDVMLSASTGPVGKTTVL